MNYLGWHACAFIAPSQNLTQYMRTRWGYYDTFAQDSVHHASSISPGPVTDCEMGVIWFSAILCLVECCNAWLLLLMIVHMLLHACAQRAPQLQDGPESHAARLC